MDHHNIEIFMTIAIVVVVLFIAISLVLYIVHIKYWNTASSVLWTRIKTHKSYQPIILIEKRKTGCRISHNFLKIKIKIWKKT